MFGPLHFLALYVIVIGGPFHMLSSSGDLAHAHKFETQDVLDIKLGMNLCMMEVSLLTVFLAVEQFINFADEAKRDSDKLEALVLHATAAITFSANLGMVIPVGILNSLQELEASVAALGAMANDLDTIVEVETMKDLGRNWNAGN